MKITLLLIILFSILSKSDIHSQWQQQNLPVNGHTVGVIFFDANTGLITLYTNHFRNYLYRTTDGCVNWSEVNLSIVKFHNIDSQTVYAIGNLNQDLNPIYRSFDRGLTWDSTAKTGDQYAGMFFLNRDTGWISGFVGSPLFDKAIWKTTNGGQTINLISTGLGFGNLFFLKQKINGEYYGWHTNAGIYKTENSGVNWSNITNDSILAYKAYFLNKDTGWVNGRPGLFKTTNAGNNWVAEPLPGGKHQSDTVLDFTVINKDTLYAVGGTMIYPSQIHRGIIWKTVNGGINWFYQQPDTSIPAARYSGCDFLNSQFGWVYNSDSILVHTSTGGVLTNIEIENNTVPEKFSLSQNYPNPFNPQTTILFSIINNSNVSLSIYDVLGRGVLKIYDNQNLKTGTYRVNLDFGDNNLPSGIYLYSIKISNANESFIESKKMVFYK